MKYVFLLLIISSLAIGLYFPHAYSDFSSNSKYIVQASGYLIGNQTIIDSNFVLELTMGSKSGNTLQSILDNGLVTIGNSQYLNSGIWQTSVLRDGKYMIIQGDAKDQTGNVIHLNLFGRIIDSNQEGYVYTITGKITGPETMKVSYSAKITAVNSTIPKPILLPTPTNQTQNTMQHHTSSPTTMNVNIVSGASNSRNGQFLSPSSIQVTPGTVVVWTNNDSIPHRIMSGQILSSTSGSPHFISDGKIDSDIIAPGQHYQVTISNNGSTQFFDPSYTWINGIIISSSTITQGTPVPISIALGSSLTKGTATQQQFNQYNSYYYPDTIQIVPGTPIIWVNNDSIEHTILSGVSTQKNDNPFTPDGKIASGKIAPGQSFMVIINDTGIIRFYDPQYTWMIGLIISMPPTSSTTIGATSHNSGLH